MQTRRQLMKAGALGTGLLAAPAFLKKAWAQQPLVVRIPGGYGDVWDVHYFQPFTKATGIPVTGTFSTDIPYSEFKISVETGSYRYDAAAAITKELITRLKSDNLVDKLDLDSPDISARPAASYNENWLTHSLYCFAMVYRTTTFPQGVSSFKDMWNVKGFPGTRALRKRAVDTIEMATRGIGVPRDKVYEFLSTPDGWDKVFAGLDEIRPHITNWWDSDATLEQMIGQGELDISPVTSHRAQRLINEGAEIAIDFNEAYYSTMGYAIPRGTPKLAQAREFIKFAAAPEREAALVKSSPMGPIHPKAFDYLAPDFAKLLPTYPENFAKMNEQDPVFWQKNDKYATTRFQEWLLKA
ncbi:extracellular solute-binding protein [Rhizobium puerariae]|uniref:Extracellular solute-binding protein n=1 Tax=Rhizobium puerariae TaxID=1585791 RepID=A0ABV6AF33_9HYPH